MLELFHGGQSNNPSSCVVLVAIESEEEIDKPIKATGDEKADSGHTLGSTTVTFYES